MGLELGSCGLGLRRVSLSVGVWIAVRVRDSKVRVVQSYYVERLKTH